MKKEEKKLGDYLGRGGRILIILSVALMPFISMFEKFGSLSQIGYLGLWFTIVAGFALLHSRMRIYKFETFEEENNE